MKILYVSGNPRKMNSNTDYLLNCVRGVTGGDLIKLIDYRIEPCNACWGCRKKPICSIDDDFRQTLIPLLLDTDALVVGSPVYFYNVTAHTKAFIDRTWSLRGKLRNKIGGAVVAGRHDGAESAITAIHAFFLKHEMIPANRGVCATAFKPGEVKEDAEAIESAARLAERLLELERVLCRTPGDGR